MSDTPQKMQRHLNGVRYTITINPDDHEQSGRGNRWTIVRTNVMEFMKDYAKYIDELELYSDISHPESIRAGTYPRIHYHGWITFKNIIGFLTSVDRNLRYSIEIDTIKDFEVWKPYCKKFIKIYPEYKMYNIKLKHLVELLKTVPKDKANIYSYLKE